MGVWWGGRCEGKDMAWMNGSEEHVCDEGHILVTMEMASFKHGWYHLMMTLRAMVSVHSQN